MKLLEYEGKALLARHGVPVARGALWPQVPESDTGWMVKAQVLAGGRGKRGGIL
ncbi:ATP-grasp domain-containing protein, partial [Gemmatimonas sp.]|uniref:ATP-grasp domain-containing protein n=1 Tax=Gemmatimonas sp. TaxID=1962908 RepID=UPI00356834FC